MINKDSIVTAYDEHLTLVEWLQKVEVALKDASAVSFNVNKRGDATLTFSVVFADGSEIETEPITLEQGESVRGATIRNGHLILTLTNGDELDAGDLGGVSGFSIDASQHLIVTYQNGTTQDLGAIFNGNVVINGALSTPILTSANDHIEAQKPVVEVMDGYSFEPSSSVEGLIFEYIYAGACKNGHKLTLVIVANLTKTQEITETSVSLGALIIPASVGNKLIPTRIESSEFLDLKYQQLYVNHYTSDLIANCFVYWGKSSNTRVYSKLVAPNNLTMGKKYFLRYEATFLLSDNLANNG